MSDDLMATMEDIIHLDSGIGLNLKEDLKVLDPMDAYADAADEKEKQWFPDWVREEASYIVNQFDGRTLEALFDELTESRDDYMRDRWEESKKQRWER